MGRKKNDEEVEGEGGDCGCLIAIFLVLAFFLGIAYINHNSRQQELQREHELKMEELRHK